MDRFFLKSKKKIKFLPGTPIPGASVKRRFGGASNPTAKEKSLKKAKTSDLQPRCYWNWIY
jgi:hypothetical protein